MGLFSKTKKEPEVIQIRIKECKFCNSDKLFQLKVSDMLTCYDYSYDVFCCRDCGRTMSERDFRIETPQQKQENVK